jgi:hypothetical protein
MRKQVDQYIRNCHSSQCSRTLTHARFGVLRPLPVPEKPWEDLSMDFMIALPQREGCDADWVVVDRLSKMHDFIRCHTTIDAVELGKLILREVVRLHGLQCTNVSD